MINAEFVKEMKNELDILEMYQHEFEMAKEEGDSEDTEYFGHEIKQENAKIMSMFYNAI